MSNWQKLINNHILPNVSGDEFWERRICNALSNDVAPYGIHLAIFNEPFLTYILQGRKTVESRFGTRRFAPYKQIAKGDIILLKKSSGPIIGISSVSEAWFYHLNPHSWDELRKEFAVALCAQDPGFWEERLHKSYATLIRLSHVRDIEPFSILKRDRRGWVVLRKTLQQTALFH